MAALYADVVAVLKSCCYLIENQALTCGQRDSVIFLMQNLAQNWHSRAECTIP